MMKLIPRKHGYSLLFISSFLFTPQVMALCTPDPEPTPSPSPTGMPALTGKLVFHRYSTYAARDSQLFMYDFPTKSLTNISRNWAVKHAMNASISPDGQWMTFMALPTSGTESWDIYVWQINSQNAPVNLTKGNGRRNEDPKFMSDSSRIVFKQNGDIKIMNRQGSLLTNVTNNGNSPEESMPVQFHNTSTILYAEGAGANSMIYSIDQSGASKTRLSQQTGLQEFYPISWLPDRFLYIRWYSPTNLNNQIYSYNLATRAVSRLPFNSAQVDTADPTAVDNRYLIVSRVVSGSGYNLYIADTQSTSVWPITNLNTSLEELGADYHP